MNCEDVSLALPWYLNGTLGPEEQARITEHLQDCESCRKELEETLWLTRAMAEHVSHQELIDLVHQKPSPNRIAVERHVAVCSRCADKKQLIEMMVRVPETVSGPDAEPAAIPMPIPETRPRPSLWQAWAIAATLIAALGLGLLMSQNVEVLPGQPTQIVELVKKRTEVRTGLSGSLNAEVLNIVLTSHPLVNFYYTLPLSADPDLYTHFSASLTANNEVLWNYSNLSPDERRGFSFTTPSDTLKAGVEHIFHFYGWGNTRIKDAAQPEKLETIVFTVERAEQTEQTSEPRL